MKQQPLLLSLLAAAALLSITGYAQKAQDARTLEQRVDDLELELQTLRSTVAGLTDSAQADAGDLDGIKSYLQQQAKSAKAMAATLTDVETQGFIAGINHKSRTTLLSGWRGQLTDQQKDVPGEPAKEEKPKSRWER